MNAENFTFFAKASKTMAMLRKVKPNMVTSWLGGIEYNAKVFDQAIAETLANSRIFEISDDIKKLLAMTDTPKKNEEVRLPFKDVFLDVAFTRAELEEFGIQPKYAEYVKGIAITTGNFILQKDNFDVNDLEQYEGQKKLGLGLRITICSVLDTGTGIDECMFDVFNKNVNLDEGAIKELGYTPEKMIVQENETTDKNVRDFIHKFVLNFLNFINSPEVTYIEHTRSEKNIERKMKQGKVIIPSTFTIKITGKLREYLDDIERQGLWEYSYKFWVRGFFRTLKDKKYKENVGKRIWIPPFIKGKGVLVEKDYLLE